MSSESESPNQTEYEPVQEPQKSVAELKQELKAAKAMSGNNILGHVKSFFNGIKNLLEGKINTVPELNYKGVGSLNSSFTIQQITPPNFDEIPVN